MDFYFSPPSEKPEDEFWSGVWDIYIELVAADKAARALAAAPPPLHHQPPPSETTSDLLRSQVTAPPPSSFSSSAQVEKTIPEPPIPFADSVREAPPTSPPSPSIPHRTAVPLPHLRPRENSSLCRTPSVHRPRCQSPPPKPFPISPRPARTPNPVQIQTRPRIFPSLLPSRETLTLSAPPPVRKAQSPPPPLPNNRRGTPPLVLAYSGRGSLPPTSPFPHSLPPVPPTPQIQIQHHHNQTNQQQPQQADVQQIQIQQKKKSEEKKKNGIADADEGTMEKMIFEQISFPVKQKEEKKLLFVAIIGLSPDENRGISCLEKQKESQSVQNLVVKIDKGTTVEKNSEWEKFFEHTSGLTKKYYQSGSIAYKDPKELPLLFEQKLEIELILIEYVDSPPTSDVSTIRGRIVFKKGRMIPNIMGLDRGRTRPPRARLKDRALRCYFMCYVILCVFMFVCVSDIIFRMFL